jgi:hypothetical protein
MFKVRVSGSFFTDKNSLVFLVVKWHWMRSRSRGNRQDASWNFEVPFSSAVTGARRILISSRRLHHSSVHQSAPEKNLVFQVSDAWSVSDVLLYSVTLLIM